MRIRNNSAKNIFLSENNESSLLSKYNEFINHHLINQLTSLEKKINKEKEIKLQKIRPNELILDALKIGEKFKFKQLFENKEKTNRFDVILDELMMARTQYAYNSKEKSICKVKEDFKNNLKSYNKQALNTLEKNLKKIIDFKQSYEKIMKENEILELKISKINDEVRMFNKNLISKNEEISEIQIKFEPYKKMMPFFEEIVHKFPDKDPQQLLNEYFENKKKSLEKLNKINKIEEEYTEINNKRQIALKKENEERKSIQSRIDHEEKLYGNRKELIEQDITLYKAQSDNIQIRNEKKIILKTMLYNIYKAIQKYIPDDIYKQFIKKTGYELKEDDFDYLVFDNKDYIKLLNEYIVNKPSECNDGRLLRNTVVFANYLSRKYLSHNKNKSYRYDPVASFKDIKSLIDNLKFDNHRLKGIILNLKHKQSDLNIRRKDLENLIKKGKIKYKELLQKFEMVKKINKSLHIFKNNNFKTLEIDKENSNTLSKRNNTIKSALKKTIQIQNNNKDKVFKSLDNKKDLFFITNMNRPLNINKKRVISSLSENKENKMHKYNKKNIFKSNKKISKIKLESDDYKELKNYFKKMKNLKISKNKDKLFKTNGFNSSENIFLNTKKFIKEILEQENMEIFKDYKLKKKKLSIETYDYFPEIIKNMINEKKNYETEESKRSFSTNTKYNNNYKDISNKILTDIDNIIDTVKELL